MYQLPFAVSDDSTALRAACLLALSILVSYRYILDLKSRSRPHPDAPPIVPSSIPWFGHVYPFLFRRSDFLKECRAKYGPNFKLFVAGQYVAIVSSPAAIADVVGKSPHTLSSMNERVFRTMTRLPPSRVPHIASVLQYQVYGIIASQISKRSMGSFFTGLSQDLSVRLDDEAQGSSSFRIPLTDLVTKNVSRAFARAFFGARVPDIYSSFVELDRDVYYMIHSIPFLGRKSHRAADHLAATLMSYADELHASGEDIYIEGASVPILESLHELKRTGVSPAEIARVLITVVWGFNSNVVHSIASGCAYVASNSHSYTRIAQHLRAVIQRRWGDLDVFLKEEPLILDDPDFEILDSVLQETLRMTCIASSARNVERDTTIWGEDGERYFLEKGERVLVDVAGMHYDPDFYPDPNVFQADRFLKRKDSSVGSTYTARGVKRLVPWGGGAFVCKGRDYAEYMFKMFLVQCLVKYDMTFPVGFKLRFRPNTSVTVARLEKNPIVHCERVRL